MFQAGYSKSSNASQSARDWQRESLYMKGTSRGIQAAHAAKLRRILALLDDAAGPVDLNIPSFRVHPLKGDLNGYWSI
ncbi:type II toxin-antitoxin system RelE/ParE family toxin [Microbulbifer sp. 2201CG32-9]|uniref:type II toxin-antitoxin system RelE/ParE family toxin n=1 Tax=Microbulbifer sp. 2201CG32-9 TaxID=3232309 RepID=UPI00345BF9F1